VSSRHDLDMLENTKSLPLPESNHAIAAHNLSLHWASSRLDDDHVEGVRRCLSTAATIGPIVQPQGDIWAWRTMVEYYRQGESPDSSTRALWKSYEQNHIAENQEELAKVVINSGFEIYTSICSNFEVVFYMPQNLSRRGDSFTSTRRKVCCEYVSYRL
jgi:hypothetical protein